jgi:small subunit ribosomal protein S19
MPRSLKKGPYIDQNLAKKVGSLRAGDKTVIKTWARASTITPEMVGFTFGVHNGREFVQVRVVENMVGHAGKAAAAPAAAPAPAAAAPKKLAR